MRYEPSHFTRRRVCAFAGAILLVACAAREDSKPSARQAGVAVPPLAVPTAKLGDIDIMLPVTENTPVGIRVDGVTIWLDSTRIGAAVSALGVKLPLGRYAPYNSLVAACIRTRDANPAYVFLKAFRTDSAPVSEVVVTTDSEEQTDPPARCKALAKSSVRLSTSLGLELGMSPARVKQLLGVPDQAKNSLPKFQNEYFEYNMGKIADDTSSAAEEHALHANVDLNAWFHAGQLVGIRIQRGRRARYYE